MSFYILLAIDISISNVVGILFTIIINTYPQLKSNNYNINGFNHYFFNNDIAPQFSIFSLYTLENNIVIQLSRNFLSIESDLIKLIDKSLQKML